MSKETARETAEKITHSYSGFRDYAGLIDALNRDITAALEERDKEIERLNWALQRINTIRNSIVGFHTVNWSEHIYPLVAALNEAGIEGMSYAEGRVNFGTMLERTNKAEAENTTLKAEVERLRGLIFDALNEGWVKHQQACEYRGDCDCGLEAWKNEARK